MEKGFLAGADVSGEFLDQLREYPQLLKETGVEGEEAIAIMTRQVKEGVYSDKGIDAIKEANIRLREMTPATKEALESIGLSSTEIQEGLENGSLKMIDVIRQVSGRLDTLPPQSQRVGQVLADVFGGAGEDAGLEFLTSLQDSNVALEEMIDRTSDLTVAQQNNLEASKLWNQVIVDLTGPNSTLGRIWSAIKLSVAGAAAAASSDSVGFWEKVWGFMDVTGIQSAKNQSKAIAERIMREQELAAEEQARREQEIEAENQKLLGQLRNECHRLKLEGIEEMDLETLQMAVNQAQKELNAEKEKQEALEKERKKAAEKQAKEKAKAEEDINKFLADAALNRELAAMGEDERELQRIRNQYDEKIRLAEEYGLSTVELEKDRLAAIKAQEEIYRQRDIEQKIALQDQLYMLGLSANERELNAVHKKYEDLWSQVESGSEEEALIMHLWNEEVAVLNDKHRLTEVQKEQQKQDQIIQAELAAIETRRSIANNLAQSMSNLLSMVAGNASEAAGFQKALALFQIGVDTASAISSLVAGAAKTGNPIAFAVQFASTLAMVTANMLKAKKMLTDDPPEAPQFMAPGGVLKGRRHSSGGNPVFDGRTGQLIAEVEEGEPFLSRETYANNREAVDALLYSSMFKNGARVDWLANAGPQMNFDKMLGAVMKFERGGVPVPRRSPSSAATGSTASSASTPHSSLEHVLNQHLILLRQLQEEGIIAMIGDSTIRELRSRDSFLKQVEDDAKIS